MIICRFSWFSIGDKGALFLSRALQFNRTLECLEWVTYIAIKLSSLSKDTLFLGLLLFVSPVFHASPFWTIQSVGSSRLVTRYRVLVPIWCRIFFLKLLATCSENIFLALRITAKHGRGRGLQAGIRNTCHRGRRVGFFRNMDHARGRKSDLRNYSSTCDWV